MSYYYNPTKEELKTWSQIKADYPNTSFPTEPNITLINDFGFEEVIFPNKPTASSNLKIIVEDGVKKEADGWTLKYKEIDRHTDYTDEDGNTVTKESQDTAYQAHLDDTQKNALRATRISLLEEADWQIHKIEDADGDSSAWRTYRQQLRDITKASDIYNVTWPTKPS